MKTEITVFTPTYNRGYTLNRLYKSLSRQTCNDFEWIIINDGSTDNTDEIIKKILKDNKKKFKIYYKKVQNGGKHRAINEGVKMAHGKWFFIVDSDDYVTDDAIETILHNTISLPRNYAGIGFNREHTDGSLVGKTFAGTYIDCKTTDRMKHNIIGDKAEVWKTEILRRFPFPSFEGENYISENVVWCQISKKGHPLRWYNKTIYIGDYLDDGLTKSNKLNEKNFQGYTFTIRTILDCNLPLIEQIIWLGNYIYTGKKLKYKIKILSKRVNASYTLSIISYILCKIKKSLN